AHALRRDVGEAVPVRALAHGVRDADGADQAFRDAAPQLAAIGDLAGRCAQPADTCYRDVAARQLLVDALEVDAAGRAYRVRQAVTRLEARRELLVLSVLVVRASRVFHVVGVDRGLVVALLVADIAEQIELVGHARSRAELHELGVHHAA